MNINNNRPVSDGFGWTEEPQLPDDLTSSSHTVSSSAGGNGLEMWRELVLLVVSITGLIGNTVMILLFVTVRRFRKPRHSFFVHHCILDVVKSSFCIVFSKVRPGLTWSWYMI